jgi:NAD+ synthase
MVLGLRDYIGKNNFPGLVIGMSGGIDSALSAIVAVDALGADKVTLVRMPSRFTSQISMTDAEEASRRLGTVMETIAISDVVDSFQGALSPLLQERMKGITSENLQARTRGTILMGISNATGLMVLSTGNKSEMSVGYATLYGDMCGGYSVLKDIWKTDVFALSTWRNTTKPSIAYGPDGEVMPVSIIERPPTAELAEDQSDEASLGSYAVLDAVLKNIIENQMDALTASRQATIQLGYTVTLEQAERIANLAWKAEYKRRQAPPGVAAGDSDYSRSWRLPITNHYGL